MSLNIDDPEADRLARDVAAITGESLTDAVKRSLAERLERERRRSRKQQVDPVEQERLVARMKQIARACASLPDYDTRSPDQIVGYDDKGMW